MRDEVWISVDVEASGPTPGTGSLISIGACRIDQPEEAFYVEIRPLPDAPWGMAEERVHRLTREHLLESGMTPHAAMTEFATWIDRQVDGATPVLVAFNAPFDWMWVADYFARFLGSNPFGISGLDLKAFFLGRHWGDVSRWRETTSAHVRERYPTSLPHTHRALDDARQQAEMARRMFGR